MYKVWPDAFLSYRKVLPKDKKALRKDAHAEAEEDVALRRFGGAKYAFTRILFHNFYRFCTQNKHKLRIYFLHQEGHEGKE